MPALNPPPTAVPTGIASPAATPGAVTVTQVQTTTTTAFPWWIPVLLVLGMVVLLAFERYRSRGLDQDD